MSITYSERNRSFRLDAGSSSYVISIFDQEQFVAHTYYGPALKDTDLDFMLLPSARACPSLVNRARTSFMDALSFEYPTFGIGDYRDHCLEVRTKSGHHACGLTYVSHQIYPGKPALPGLPATFGEEDACTTLELTCQDAVLNLEVVLYYTTFEKLDVIARSAVITNRAEEEIYLERALSGALDLQGQQYDILTLHGSWAKECRLTRTPVSGNRILSESSRGETSAQSSPFLGIAAKNADEDHGSVYGMNLVYSGNFYASAEGHHNGGTRAVMGINPLTFGWKLDPGESFTTPELVMVYSNEGLGKMTRTFHDLYRQHLIRCPYGDKDRPILVNNWEATYFNFNETKILELAKSAAACGIEMLVLDDGWFGARNDDSKGLGDWVVNEDKLKGGLGKLTNEINALGMKFGLWIEPEMVNPDSDLYRAHPDWAIQIPGRPCSLGRDQLVLDWSRKEVRDHVYNQIKEVLDNANVEYIKWDMNRHLTELGSFALTADCQKELSHRYVMGVYDIMERLKQDYPKLLHENCSSGGARFDAGVLYYSPQIWTSDDTDAIERIRIQAGTSLCYPLSTMGAHVSAVPNHQTGRITPFMTRGIVALFGTFGYELDITKLSGEEQDMIRKQTAMYHKYSHLVREGDLYRLTDVFHPGNTAAWSLVSKDKKEALVAFVQIHSAPGDLEDDLLIHLKGLDPDAIYELEEHVGGIEADENGRFNFFLGTPGSHMPGQVFRASGQALMSGNFWMDKINEDYAAQLLHFVKVQ